MNLTLPTMQPVMCSRQLIGSMWIQGLVEKSTVAKWSGRGSQPGVLYLGFCGQFSCADH